MSIKKALDQKLRSRMKDGTMTSWGGLISLEDASFPISFNSNANISPVSSFLVLDFYCSRTAEISEQSRIEREARKRKSFDHD